MPVSDDQLTSAARTFFRDRYRRYQNHWSFPEIVQESQDEIYQIDKNHILELSSCFVAKFFSVFLPPPRSRIISIGVGVHLQIHASSLRLSAECSELRYIQISHLEP